MTKKKRNRKGKGKKLSSLQDSMDESPIPPPTSLKEAVDRIQPLPSLSFDSFHMISCTRYFTFFQSLVTSSYHYARQYNYLPFPLAALCKDKSNKIHIIHGISQVDIPGSSSQWNHRWIGFIGNSFESDYSKVNMVVIRGKFTRPITFHTHIDPNFYQSMNKEDFEKVKKLSPETEEAIVCFTRKLLFLQPNWVSVLSELSLDVYSVYSFLQNILEKEALSEYQREAIENYSKALVHTGVSTLHLETFDMDEEVKEWKRKQLYFLYGDPSKLCSRWCKLYSDVMEDILSTIKKNYNENDKKVAQEVSGSLYSTKIGKKLCLSIRKFAFKKGFIECFYHHEDMEVCLRFLKKLSCDGNEFNGIIQVVVEANTIIIEEKTIEKQEIMLPHVHLLVDDDKSPLHNYHIEMLSLSDVDDEDDESDESLEYVD